MADIFQEIEEDLKRDQYRKLWQRHGRFVIAMAVVVVVAVAGYKGWQAWDLRQQIERSERFAAARALADSRSGTAAAEAFAGLAEADGAGYAMLAAFEEARLRAAAGDEAGAIAIWDRLADNGSAGPPLRGLATLLSVMHQLDDGDPAALEARLRPLTEDAGAYRANAVELTALLALRQGDKERARTLYASVADDLSAPQGLRARATQMVAALDG